MRPSIAQMQALCRETMAFIAEKITPGMNLNQVRKECERYLLSNGADSFWYWDVGAFIFRGEDTRLSVSGKHYQTADALLEENDILTIDLSPQNQNVWGDYARTLILEKGAVVRTVQEIQCDDWRMGLETEEFLHEAMENFVTIDTTFEDLYNYINALIQEKNHVNLDFLGNLGHSIVDEKKKRIYIEKGNHKKLSSVEAFTFEPHIGAPGGKYGYKKENIYSFQNGKVVEL